MKILIKLRLCSVCAVIDKFGNISFQIISLVNYSSGQFFRIIRIKSGISPELGIHSFPIIRKECYKIVQIVPLAEYAMIFVQIVFIKTDAIEPIFIYFYNLHFLTYRLNLLQKYD